MDWLSFKTHLTEVTQLSRDALHVLGGCGLHLLLVIAFRSWLGALWPLAVILLAEGANEWVDLSDPWAGAMRTRQYFESGKDVVLTLAIPLSLVLLARIAPQRFRRRERPVPPSQGPAGDPLP